MIPKSQWDIAPMVYFFLSLFTTAISRMQLAPHCLYSRIQADRVNLNKPMLWQRHKKAGG